MWFGDGVPVNGITNIASLTVSGVFAAIAFGNPVNTDEPTSFTSSGGVVYFGFNGNFYQGLGYVPYGSTTTALLGLSTTTGYTIGDLTMASNHEIYAAGPWSGFLTSDFLFRCPTDGSTCTVYALDSPPAALTGVHGIAMGADGNLWLTAPTANAILKISLSGTILASYALPTANSEPWEIISAPDGSLWFTESGANKLGRMTTSGALTEYAIPTPNADPYGITTCPTQCSDAHGRIWFTEYAANKVGKLQY